MWVDYHYGFSADMGGGEYPRTLSPRAGRELYRVGPGGDFESIMDAYRRWRDDRAEDKAKGGAIIELTSSGVYQDREPIDIELDWGDRLELRAAQGTRPVIRLLDLFSNRPDALRIRGPLKRPRPRPGPRARRTAGDA